MFDVLGLRFPSSGSSRFSSRFRRGHLYHTQRLQPTPGTGRPSQQLAGYRPKNRVTWVVWLSFRVAAGISFQLPRGMSGHILNSPVVLGCACWWLSLVWLGAGASGSFVPGAGSWGCVLFVSLSGDGRPMDRHFCRYSPLSSGTSIPCTRSPESAGHFFVNFVMGLMVGDRRFPGATLLVVRFSTSSANHPASVPPTGSVHRDGFSLRVCSGSSVHSTRGVAASFLTRCRGSRLPRPRRCGDFGMVSNIAF